MLSRALAHLTVAAFLGAPSHASAQRLSVGARDNNVGTVVAAINRIDAELGEFHVLKADGIDQILLVAVGGVFNEETTPALSNALDRNRSGLLAVRNALSAHPPAVQALEACGLAPADVIALDVTGDDVFLYVQTRSAIPRN